MTKERESTVRLNAPYIRELMRAKALDETRLAHLLGIAPSTLRRLLDKQTVHVDYGKAIAGMLNVPIVEITLAQAVRRGSRD